MKATDLMTSNPSAVTANESVRHAAELMRDIGVGSLPVIGDHGTRELIGIITDRDIVVRCVADGHGVGCPVKAHMTPLPLQTVEPEDDERVVIDKMERAQVRRIPVVTPDEVVVGIIAQADVARKLGPTEPDVIDEVLEKISAPQPSAAV